MMNVVKDGLGWVEVICGSMFSGKTEELIRRLRRAQIAKLKVEIFKPAIDNRYSEDHIVSHNEQRIPSIAVTKAQDILDNVGDAQVIGIDEGQFFGMELVDVCNTLADRGLRVIVAGLDQDFRGYHLSRFRNYLLSRNRSPRHWRSVWSAAVPQTARNA